MFETWGRMVYRGRRVVLLLGVAFVVFGAVWGLGVFGKLSASTDFTPPDSQSQREANLADQVFGRGGADVVLLYRSTTATVADPAFRAAVYAAIDRVPRADLTGVETYWSTRSSSMVSKDQHASYAVLQLTGDSDAARQTTYTNIEKDLQGIPGVSVGGTDPVMVAINNETTANIGKAEAFAMPVVLILMLLIFGSLVAAAMPLVIGVVAILGSFTVLRLLTMVTTVSTFSTNITTILGLGLGIDYGLFIVTRFREELRRQPDVQSAVARTVATAGRTVAISGVTVAVALTSLMLFPVGLLRSMGYGGVATVAVDVIAALTILPALLAVLGTRVNAVRIRRSAAAPAAVAASGAWYRIARSVMRRPVVYLVVIVIGLLALGAPFLRIQWGGTDARTLPPQSVIRQVSDALDTQFPANATAPIELMVSHADPSALPGYLVRIDAIGGVTGADVTGLKGGTARIDVEYSPATISQQARHIVTEIRDLTPPDGATVLVGGQTAQLVDELSALGAALPWMALLVGLATVVLLFLAFGSVVLPLKAIVMNVLSLSATFGVIVWIFQWGHLSGLLRFTPTGSIDPTMPILMLAIIFGLSMDYEVFLLSRIRELYDQTGDNTAAVAGGLQRTGGMITSLALLLIVVVGAFSASGITFIKLTGVGMIVALVIDASVVRVLLVPAAMRLLGRANWWVPRPLDRLFARFAIREESSDPPVPVAW
jgi:trehalose monomycolate/heme transporter